MSGFCSAAWYSGFDSSTLSYCWVVTSLAIVSSYLAQKVFLQVLFSCFLLDLLGLNFLFFNLFINEFVESLTLRKVKCFSVRLVELKNSLNWFNALIVTFFLQAFTLATKDIFESLLSILAISKMSSSLQAWRGKSFVLESGQDWFFDVLTVLVWQHAKHVCVFNALLVCQQRNICGPRFWNLVHGNLLL